MARPRISLLTLTTAAVVLATSGASPISAEPKKISKGSGQYEEHYELVPDDDPNAPPPPGAAGNLDPEGDSAPAKSKGAPPATPHKGPFVGAGAAPAPVKRPAAVDNAPPATAYPQPERIGEQPEKHDSKTAKPDTPEKAEARQPTEPAPRYAKQQKASEGETTAQEAAPERKRSVRTASPDEDAAASNTAFFYGAVAEGGAWIDHPRYGRVFAPKVAETWRPYTLGRWAFSDDYGWLWISDEPFGWATYHYGRWALEADKGWFWVPGKDWAPAWVVWRQGEDAIGWAALPPGAEMTGKGLSLETSIIETSRFESTWVFVDPRYFGQPGMRRYLRSTRWNADLVPTTVTRLGYERKDDVVVNRGIAPEDVAHLTGRPLQRVTLTLADDTRFKRSDSSRGGDEVKLYRPGAKTIDSGAAMSAKVRRPDDSSNDGDVKPRKQAAKIVTKFSPPPVVQRIETESGVTESWVTPSTQPQAAAKEAESQAGKKSESDAKSSKHTAERTFAPATSQRTETEGSVTESWATPPSSPSSSARSESAPQKNAKGSSSPAAADAAASGKAKADSSVRKSAERDPLSVQHDHGSRYESYSAVPADGTAKDAATSPDTPKKKSSSQAVEESGPSTGSVSNSKRRWDGSGASGGPAVPPGLAQ